MYKNAVVAKPSTTNLPRLTQGISGTAILNNYTKYIARKKTATQKWDPRLQEHRNDLAYSMYMLRRRSRQIENSIAAIRVRNAERRLSRAHTILLERNATNSPVSHVGQAGHVTPRQGRNTSQSYPGTVKLPRVDNRYRISKEHDRET